MRSLFACVLLFCAFSIDAQLESSTIYWENDTFGIGRKSDRFYTNGARMTVLLSGDAAARWRWPQRFREWFCERACGEEEYVESVGLTFGSNFYTPEVITIRAPQPFDRPWAGVTYVGISESITNAPQTLQHAFEVTLGILGPGAGAQATQKFVHNDLGLSDNDPRGWPNQLENEPALALMYAQTRRYGLFGRPENIDVVPSFGGMLGSPMTYANAGGLVRLGFHISGLPATMIRNTVSVREQVPHRWELYVFGGGDARFVPFNATLDGGLFRDGPEAPGAKRFVTDVRAGVSARYKWLRITYSVVDRSAEFDVPAGREKSQRFGAFALTIEPFDTFR